MVRQVDDRVSIGRSAIVDAQLVITQTVIDECFNVPRITFLAVLAEVRQSQNVAFFGCGPNTFVEPAETAVQMVRAVVSRQLILDAIQRESSLRNAVRVTP